MKLDICLSSDEYYCQYMAATISSILSNSDNDDILIFHILDGGISLESKNKLLNLKRIKYFEIRFYKPNIEKYQKWFEMSKLKVKFPPAIFYRLDIHRLIPDVDKILYLDCDIIVRSSLQELFTIDINNYYLLAVQDGAEWLKKENQFYFNSGMIMINSKLWRENEVEKDFEEYYLSNTDCYGDQDILNFCLNSKVKEIEEKWNFSNDYHCHRKKLSVNLDDINILHCVIKPWKKDCKNAYFIEEFWKYYQLTPWFLERPVDNIEIILSQKYGDYEENKLKLNNIRLFGIYYNKNYIEIILFFLKIRLELNYYNLNKLVWFIPIRKYRDRIREYFDL